jgi:hypothetical protein
VRARARTRMCVCVCVCVCVYVCVCMCGNRQCSCIAANDPPFSLLLILGQIHTGYSVLYLCCLMLVGQAADIKCVMCNLFRFII